MYGPNQSLPTSLQRLPFEQGLPGFLDRMAFPHSEHRVAPCAIWVCLGCGFHHLEEVPPRCCPRCTGDRILSGFGFPE